MGPLQISVALPTWACYQGISYTSNTEKHETLRNSFFCLGSFIFSLRPSKFWWFFMVLVLYIFITPIHILTIFYGFGTIYFHYAHPYSDDFLSFWYNIFSLRPSIFWWFCYYIFSLRPSIFWRFLIVLVKYIFITPIYDFATLYYPYAHPYSVIYSVLY